MKKRKESEEEERLEEVGKDVAKNLGKGDTGILLYLSREWW